MRKTLRILVPSLLLIFAVLITLSWFNCGVSEESEEYAVYSAVINKLFVKDNVKRLVINNQTLFYANPTSKFSEDMTSEFRIRHMKEDFHSASDEVIRDYDAKNLQSEKLSAKFNLPIEYILINESELEKDEDGTRIYSFNHKYQDVGGMISVSKVGFNKARNEALIRVEFTYSLGSFSREFLLKKESGGWKIVETYLNWIS